MRIKRIFPLIVFLICIVFCLIACGNDQTAVVETAPPETPAVIPVEATPVPTPQPTPEPTPVPTPPPAAEPVTLTVSYRDRLYPELYDGDHSTIKNFMPGEPMVVQAEEDMYALYIEWDYRPKPWTLLCGEHELSQGEHGFHHEYIVLPEPKREVTIMLPQGEEPVIAEITGFSAGTRPDWVQDWQEPWDQADLLVFPTHSDDEFIFLGGLIPYYLEQGKRVQVAYVIRHYGYRYHEMLDSLWEAGVRHYPITSTRPDVYKETVDEAIEYYKLEYMTSYMAEQIRRFRPQVVVGQAEDGDSGHPVHIFGVICLKNAVEHSGEDWAWPESAEQYGTWDVPKTYLHRYGPEEKMVTLDFDRPLAGFSGASAFDVADRAFARCISQYGGGKYQVYRADSPHDSRLYGLYRTLVGEDIACNDLFENIP